MASRWVKSDWKKDENVAGQWNYTSGKWNRDSTDKGIQTSEGYRFYAISAEFPEFSNKDKILVFQFSVKHEQKLDCGGGYMKFLSGEIDQKKFGGDTPYNIMFGPDICGLTTKKVHAILTYKGTNHLIKKEVPCETDLMLLTASLLTTLRSRLVACTLIGIFSHQRRSRIQRPRSLKIGMMRSTFLTPKTRSLRVMMTSPWRYQIRMLKSLRTGTMKKTVSGHHPQLPTLNTRVHGSQRKVRTPTTRENGRHQ